MVAIPGNDLPATTPVVSASRTRSRTAIFLLLGVLSFVIAPIVIRPGPGELNEGREFHREPPKLPAIRGGGGGLFFLRH